MPAECHERQNHNCHQDYQVHDADFANANLRAALDELGASTTQIRKLQGGLQTLCAWTKRVKVGEEWMTPGEFLRTQLHLKLSHGVSPQAFRGLEQELADTA